VNFIIEYLVHCPYCKQFTKSLEEPPPLLKKYMKEKGVDTWIATKPCLNCSEEK
jgi:hypothetical protein